MSLVVKLLLALLNAVPAILKAAQDHKREQDAKKTEAAIDSDAYGEWGNRFGQLRDDTYSDPAARCLCDTTIDCDPTNSPCTGRGGIPPKDGSDKATEVH